MCTKMQCQGVGIVKNKFAACCVKQVSACVCECVCLCVCARNKWKRFGTSLLFRDKTVEIVCCSELQCVAVCCSELQRVAVSCSVLQCVAVCCSVLQCAAVCCSVLQ